MRIITTVVSLLAISLALSGCVGVAKFSQIEPVSFRPSGANPQKAIVVHSLSPTFQWKPAPDATSYDLAIWRIGPDQAPGEIEYYKEEIEGTSHTVEKVLLPGEYYWSVKKHDSGVWSTASFKSINPIFLSWGHGLPFKIKVEAK